MKLLITAIALIFSFQALAGNGTWYSDHYNKYFQKNGQCSQYNYTDSKTCNTGKDHMKCDWNHHSQTCYTEHHNGGSGKHDTWFSKKYNKHFKKKGHCGQYDYTDHKTCNTGKDHMQCDWNGHSTCYSS